MARRKNPRLPEGDDGETIVKMDVPGMPWYARKPEKPEENAGSASPAYEMTKEEERMYRHAAVKAGLVIVLIFGVVFGLFIAFCDFVWFK